MRLVPRTFLAASLATFLTATAALAGSPHSGCPAGPHGGGGSTSRTAPSSSRAARSPPPRLWRRRSPCGARPISSSARDSIGRGVFGATLSPGSARSRVASIDPGGRRASARGRLHPRCRWAGSWAALSGAHPAGEAGWRQSDAMRARSAMMIGRDADHDEESAPA